MGCLTEFLFPRELFKFLIINPEKHWLTPEWYYYWSLITPLWNRKKEPWRTPASNHSHEQSGIWTADMPCVETSEHGCAAAILLSTWLHTGSVSEPHRCQDCHPLVCDLGLVWPQGCTWGTINLLPTSYDLRDNCEVTLKNQVQVYIPLATNELVAMICSEIVVLEWCLNIQQ